MKLCILFTVWGDSELFQHCLSHAVNNLMGGNGDNVMVIYSTTSNFGEYSEPPHYFHGAGSLNFEPDLKLDARTNETAKRNFALKWAKENGFTHFLMADEDEFYEPEEFLREKKRFENPNLAGLVCRVKCYFGSPTLTIGYDTTLVPFIHKITPTISHEFNRNYPFAWTDKDGEAFTQKKRIRIDPTRSLNINSGVEWSDITLHHYSWVRKDPQKKIRNSTARANIERSSVVQDFLNAKEGYFCQFYGKVLQRSPDIFGLNENTSIQPPLPATGTGGTDRSF